MENILRCPITNEIFLDPVIASDKQTYERQALINWLKRNKTSPKTRAEMDYEGIIDNFTVKQMVEEYLKTNPDKKEEQYQFDNRYEVNKKNIKTLINKKMYDGLKNYIQFDLKDLIKKKKFKQILENADNRIVKHIIDNSLDLDCADLKKGPANNIIKYSNKDIIKYFLNKNKQSEFLKSKNYFCKTIFRKKMDKDLIKFVCENFEIDINTKDGSKYQNTPLMVLIYNFKENISEEFVQYFCEKFGFSFDWNIKNNKDQSALFFLFDNNNIDWSKTQIFIEHFDVNNKPDFMQKYENQDETILHKLCRQPSIPKNFIKYLNLNFKNDLDFNKKSLDNSTPFLKLCSNCEYIERIKYVFDNFDIQKDNKILEIMKERQNDFDNKKLASFLFKLLFKSNIEISLTKNKKANCYNIEIKF